MKAVVITRPGGPEVLELMSVPDPVPGPEEVRVRVRASALNRADLLQRRGHYPAPPGSPRDIPGLEFAGSVEACGERVGTLEPGDRVMGIVGGGGQAELLTLHERLCLRVPPALDWATAAAVPEAFLTAYDALFRQGRLAPGETLLLPAAGSGVGTAAAQVAAVSGAFVIGLSRTAAKRQRLEELGLHRVIDPDAGDLVSTVRLAAPTGHVDLILDSIGAAAWPAHIELLGDRGRLILIGLMGGSRPQVDLTPILTKRLHIAGTVLRSRPLEEKIALVQEFSRRVLPLLASGRIAPVVDRSIDWQRVGDAHRVMERNENFGKIVLHFDGTTGR